MKQTADPLNMLLVADYLITTNEEGNRWRHFLDQSLNQASTQTDFTHIREQDSM